ncbi:MAG: prolipoprotein diacylglyceryl transferase [Rhodoblastus sp.]|nr:prolipoprotein diacylglyceryl transferase [Rhodoblastus sp.]MCB1523338.1 prolipoprotein diacylglyceryl transferase [Rhodoblastus sp.]MCC2110302.1 prolipoprotein diacylglyceryl transferase [Hyphomicrobiales bacterium]
MPLLAIPFPVIDPVFFSIGPLPVRWYGLAYVFGLLLGWLYARRLVRADALWGETPRPTADSLDDLLVFSALGAVVGGRLFNVLFYGLDYYIAHPAEILAVWHGGMAFHGGLLGVALGAWLFARKYGISAFTVADICGAVAPIGIFFGRVANFIKPEMWGRPTDVPWAVIFPGVEGARHPSQLYEAGLEGLLLLVITAFFARAGGFRRPGLVAGVFGVGYGLARIVSEFFREPDPQLEALAHGLTMGMVLSAPMIVVGLWLILHSRKAAGAKP